MNISRIIVGELSTNCYLVASRKGEAFVIDPGDDAAEIKAALEENGLKARFIVLTHGHIDHVKAAKELCLPVFIHKADAEIVLKPEKNPMSIFFGTFEPVLPQKELSDGDHIELEELDFEVFHTPGHTQGCVCLYGHGCLFSGDTLFRHGVGRTDFPGASEIDMESSLKRLSTLPGQTKVYPGHGPDTTIGREFGQQKQ